MQPPGEVGDVAVEFGEAVGGRGPMVGFGTVGGGEGVAPIAVAVGAEDRVGEPSGDGVMQGRLAEVDRGRMLGRYLGRALLVRVAEVVAVAGAAAGVADHAESTDPASYESAVQVDGAVASLVVGAGATGGLVGSRFGLNGLVLLDADDGRVHEFRGPDPLAADLLTGAGLNRRWAHVQGVARRAAQLACTVGHDERDLLVAAAWLHDIGYAPSLYGTGLHSLDGAHHLASLGYDPRLCALVAHHSGARFEAAERSLTTELDAYPYKDSPISDALTAADLTTSPDGNPVTAEQRIDEILTRYPPDNPVHRAITTGRPILIAAVGRALGRVGAPFPA